MIYFKWSAKWSANFLGEKRWSETGRFSRICGRHQKKSVGHTAHFRSGFNYLYQFLETHKTRSSTHPQEQQSEGKT